MTSSVEGLSGNTDPNTIEKQDILDFEDCDRLCLVKKGSEHSLRFKFSKELKHGNVVKLISSSHPHLGIVPRHKEPKLHANRYSYVEFSVQHYDNGRYFLHAFLT